MPTLVVSFVAFILGFVGSMPVAGPVSVMIVSRCAEKHFRAARRLALGAACAEALYAGLAFFGLQAFLSRYSAALPISHGVTAVVLFAVGVRFVRWKKGQDAGKRRGPERRSDFVLGLSISLLNPTLLVTWTAVTTALYSRQLVPMRPAMALPFGLAAGAGAATWNVILIAVLERFANRFPERAVTWTVRAMGMLLVAIAAWSGVDLVRGLVMDARA
jgi:threonine/homoserine/homoserine lactone efflux protein